MASVDQSHCYVGKNADKNKVVVLHSPRAETNCNLILEVLRQHLPPEGALNVLELASGSGQHVLHFASHLPHVTWQPSDCDHPCLLSIEGYIRTKKLRNIKPPVFVDTNQSPSLWPVGGAESYDAMLCINMIHISVWTSAVGLFKGADYLLKENGLLFIYGPLMFNGKISPESNIRYDQNLKKSCSEWGLRDFDDLQVLASGNNLLLEKRVVMPANNFTLIYRKTKKSNIQQNI